MSQETTIITERMMGVAALASLTAGIVAGIGARIIMRIVAVTSHMPPTFSILGTLVILLNGLINGLTLGVAEKLFDHYLPRKPTPTSTDISTPVPGEE